MKVLRSFALGLWLMACCAGTAHAQEVQVFTSRAPFDAATSGAALHTLDFEGAEVQAQELVYPGVTFSSNDATVEGLWIISPFYYGGITSNVLVGNHSSNSVIATFAEGTNAVGTDLFSLVEGSYLFVTLSTTAGEMTIPLSVVPDAPVFLGVVVKGGALLRMTVSPEDGAYAAVDNFACGTVVFDPLPQALAALFASVGEGIEDGTIHCRGNALSALLDRVQRAWDAADRAQLRVALRALYNFVRARAGKCIAWERARALVEIIRQAQDNL
ncbi:MAG: hypothetical protein HY320_08040 [Armatimonadetes bacterium]|nr:hypothetical protein [Armatimonadota bacterium]